MRAHALTLTETLFPSRSLAREGALVGGFVALTALLAQVAVPLPFSPVPLTGQTFAVLLCGAALGRRRGALAQAAYVGLGGAGLPIFSRGGHGLNVATAGYLLGFVAAAYLVGWLVERGWDRRPGAAALAMAAGNLVIYACGLAWLWLCTGAPLGRLLLMGAVPFLPGDAAKIALASALLPGAWALVRYRERG